MVQMEFCWKLDDNGMLTVLSDEAWKNNNWGGENVRQVTVRDGVTNIGEWVFEGCLSMTGINIPCSVTGIGTGAFMYCRSLASISIPASVTMIGEGAFDDCRSLTGIGVAADNPNYTSENGALINKDKAELVQYPIGKTESSYTVPCSVTGIGYGAFHGCRYLTNVTLSNSVTKIGNCAFCGCSSLTGITIPDSVTSIGNWAFWGCTSLTSVVLPQNCTVAENAFANCPAEIIRK